MRLIYKYKIKPLTIQTLPIPKGAKILYVGLQRTLDFELCFWAEIETEYEHEAEYRDFAVVGTGQEVPRNGRYIGTGQEPNHIFVWHLYEITEAK